MNYTVITSPKMFWLTLVLLVIPTTSAQDNETAVPLVVPLAVPRVVDYCLQQSNLIFVEITKRFIEDQHFLTGIETRQSEDGKLITLHCVLHGITNPVVLYTLEE